MKQKKSSEISYLKELFVQQFDPLTVSYAVYDQVLYM